MRNPGLFVLPPATESGDDQSPKETRNRFLSVNIDLGQMDNPRRFSSVSLASGLVFKGTFFWEVSD